MAERRSTEQAREVMRLTIEELSGFNHEHVDPAHLLAGLLRKEDGSDTRALFTNW